MALKLLGRCGEQQLALHARRSSTAGDAWLLVARLHPVRQPEQTAVTVQGVGTNSPEGEGSEVKGQGQAIVENCCLL